MDESAKRIQKAARGTPDDHFLILLAHNGPSGDTWLFNFVISSVGTACLSHLIHILMFNFNSV